jgi:hypothetical protein
LVSATTWIAKPKPQPQLAESIGVRDDLRSEPLSGHPSQGDAMARKAVGIGPSSLGLIEEAPKRLMRCGPLRVL